MTYQEFEKEKGIKLGSGLVKIWKKKVCDNARFLPGKLTPDQFWQLCQINQAKIGDLNG